jgi:DNA-binding MarR family transcriptional regulator
MVKSEMSLASLKVLRAFLDDPGGQHYGLRLIGATGVKAGSLYPILSRLEGDGLISGEWESIDEAAEGRRRRRYYKLTALGQRTAIAVLSETARVLAPPRLGLAAE